MRKIFYKFREVRHDALAIVCGVALAACGDHHGNKATTQVAARVGSYEITAYQVNNAVARIPNVAPTQMEAAKTKVLDSLVNQQLAINQAQVLKLDRDPTVLASIEDARRAVLERAYFDHLLGGQPKPTDGDIHKYYTDHPELFSARRIYTLKEVTAASPSREVVTYAHDFQASGKPIEQFSAWLQQQSVHFSTDTATRPPETLPLDFLPQLAQTRDGGIVFMTTDSGLYVAQVVTSKPAPVAETDAAPAIRRYLENLHSKETIEQDLAHLRAATKIEYATEYANDTGAGATPVAAKTAPAAATVPAAAEAGTTAAVPSKGATGQTDTTVVQKGIGGMK